MLDGEKQEVFREYGENAANYFVKSLNNTCTTKPFFIACSFPQFSTMHQSFTPEQFQAYVELGEHAIARHLMIKQSRQGVEIEALPLSPKLPGKTMPLMSSLQ